MPRRRIGGMRNPSPCYRYKPAPARRQTCRPAALPALLPCSIRIPLCSSFPLLILILLVLRALPDRRCSDDSPTPGMCIPCWIQIRGSSEGNERCRKCSHLGHATRIQSTCPATSLSSRAGRQGATANDLAFTTRTGREDLETLVHAQAPERCAERVSGDLLAEHDHEIIANPSTTSCP